MKLKYYLRGLGIGVAVTALVMSLTTPKENLTDAEIRVRAKALGMSEEGVLADLIKEEPAAETVEETVTEPEAESSDEIVGQEIPAEGEIVTGEDEAATEEEAAPVGEENLTEEEMAASEPGQEAGNALGNEGTKADTSAGSNVTVEGDASVSEEKIENYIVITVERGNGSDTVSRKLYEAGLVNSAVDYDRYLISNGYDRKLTTGNHEIPAGADEETIARILCRMQ